MGINVGGASGGVKSDINVTPLVDVVLVLLIIFIVMTPVLLKKITLEVPRDADATEQPLLASKQIVVLLRANGQFKVSEGNDDYEIPGTQLGKTVRRMLKEKRGEKVVFMEIEKRVRYGDAVRAMDVIVGAGAKKVALKTEDKTIPATPR